MSTLQIPYALTNNKLPVSPQVAEKGKVYSCPVCDSEVFLKRGEIRTPHFAHKPDTGCSGEGVVHKVVKQMIYCMYRRTIDTPMASIGIFRKCPNCSQYAVFIQFRSGYDDDIKCEVDVSGYRVDIAIYRNGKPTYGIEVRDTHPVDDAKWDAFAEIQFPCIEVECKDVIRMWEYDLASWRDPIPNLLFPMRLDLKAIKHNLHLFNDRLFRVHCAECDNDVDFQEEEEEDISEEYSEILDDIQRQVPGLLARELMSILSMQNKK